MQIQNKVYTMSTAKNGDSAEITMYGTICETIPVDWWTGEPIPGEYITEEEFMADLDTIANVKNITIRMNSYGGDAGVSMVIHNRLRELSANGANITCIVDGVAMSGGSIIMSAADVVKVNPTSLIMIHKSWSTFWGNYNADDLRESANSLDAWDKAQAAAYVRKTGLSETVINHMMADTTYMTGKEAVDKGFADELIEDAEPIKIAASADGKSIFLNGRQMFLAPGVFAPDNIPTVSIPGPDPSPIEPVPDGTNIKKQTESEEKQMASTIEELRAEYPELVSQVEAAAASVAVEQERKRQQEIDAVANQMDAEIVQAARYGDTACTAQELCYRAMMANAKKGAEQLKNMADDAKASGADGVTAVPAPTDEPTEPQTEEDKQAKANADIHALLHPDKKGE